MNQKDLMHNVAKLGPSDPVECRGRFFPNLKEYCPKVSKNKHN